MRIIAAVCVGVAGLWLAGCCNCIKPPAVDMRPLPAAISLDEQLQLLNQRASELPRLKAQAESGGVELWYTEGAGGTGKAHHESGEGTILLEQNYADHTANVRLIARALGQEIFELGRNAQVEWRIEYDHQPRAWVWPVEGIVDLWNAPPPSPPQPQNNLLQAGLIPQVLAITEIVAEPGGAGAGGGGGAIAMRVDDLRGVNDLLIEHRRADGSMAVEREILVDRRSGEVREVDLFGPGGVLLIHATMDNYAEVVPTGGGGAKPADGVTPTMPRRIVIDQPATHLRIGLTLAGWQMPAQLPAAAFETPDWAEEGITPIQGQ
jgi:hypothetical protein